MTKNGEYLFGVGAAEHFSQFWRSHFPVRVFKRGNQCQLQPDYGPGCFLAGLNPRLVIGVDADQGGVQSDCPLEERNQNANSSCIDSLHADRHRLPTLLMQCLPGAAQETKQEIAAGNPLLHIDRGAAAVLEHLDEGHEEIGNPFP